MSKVGIFFGSSVGTTERVAKIVKKNIDSQLFEVGANRCHIEEFDKIIFATSTWGSGALQENFEAHIDKIKSIDFTGKKVALLGVGDQNRYSETFINGIAILKEIVEANGGTIVGKISTDGYEFDNENVVEDGKLIGLGIDFVSQKDLTQERVEKWCEQLKTEF